MLLKNVTLALASVVVLSASANANDLMNDLATMDLASINDSAADVEEFDPAGLDMDQLAEEAGEAEETDAIETCFRRLGGFRGGYGGWRHWGGGFHGGFYNHCYSYCRPLYCYRPIVRTYCAPICAPVITSYWGCF